MFDGHGGKSIVNYVHEHFAGVLEANLAKAKKQKAKYVAN